MSGNDAKQVMMTDALVVDPAGWLRLVLVQLVQLVLTVAIQARPIRQP